MTVLTMRRFAIVIELTCNEFVVPVSDTIYRTRTGADAKRMRA